MSSSSSNAWRRVALSLGVPAWVFLGFMLAQALLLVGISALQHVGVEFSVFNPFLLNAVLSVVIYALALLLVIGLPWVIKRYRTSLSELGLHRWPSWKDVIWLPLGAVGYVILSALLTSVALVTLPFFDSQQAQDTGFSGISGQFEYPLPLACFQRLHH